VDGFGHPTVVTTARYLPITHIGGTWQVNFADGPGRLSDRATAYPLLRMGRHTGQDEVVQHALAINKHTAGDGSMVRRLASVGRLVGLLLDTPRPTEGTAYPYPADGFYPKTEVLTARQTPGSATGLYLAVKGGHNSESHNHNDVGSFVVALDGRPMVVDIGVGTYTRQTFSADRYSIFTMHSDFHNVPQVNGCSQPPGREFATRGLAAAISTESAECRMDLVDAYPATAGLQHWQREARLDRNASAAVTVTDTWSLTSTPSSLVWHLIVHEDVEVAGDRVLVGDPRTRRLVISTDPVLTVEVEQIDLTDVRLTDVWGPTLHRLVLTANPSPLSPSGMLRTTFVAEV